MVAGARAHAVLDPRRAARGRHVQARDLAGVRAEAVEERAGVDVPEADAEVDRAGDEVRHVVARVLVVRVQQAVNPTAVAQKDLRPEGDR